ncbi:hypothetical protein PYCH_04470 [Pyrococcus yayanosii CH1]|uniref:Uncharacterized protein n=2 Tax=Pyrococcus TaxID=2260 RepID=F8AHE0_PYRYC|nr:hypothetical protein PYCH_04470 [Pyrococcus yayanosii CH1]
MELLSRLRSGGKRERLEFAVGLLEHLLMDGDAPLEDSLDELYRLLKEMLLADCNSNILEAFEEIVLARYALSKKPPVERHLQKAHEVLREYLG